MWIMSENTVRGLPAGFIDSVRPLLGAETEEFLSALDSAPPVSVRLSRKVRSVDGYSGVPASWRPVPWCPDGYYLPERPPFTLDPLLHAGVYYVQEASSMFLWQVLVQHAAPDWLVLDMCAAPGGKSTLIGSFLSERGFLVCNEFVPQRANILAENISKWGRGNTLVTNNAPAHFGQYGGLFDAVVVDAPCSGEGMFRKDEGAIAEWSPANVAKCVVRQREILSSAWDALKPGGLLVYSTCTYNRMENEENVQWLMAEYGAELLDVATDGAWGVWRTECGCRFMPHRTLGEGLFMAAVRKPGERGGDRAFRLPKRLPEKEEGLLRWIDTRGWTTLLHKEVYYAVQESRYPMVLSMTQNLNVLQFGVPLAVRKGKDFVPQQGLALSGLLAEGAFPVCGLDYRQAVTFLRAEAMMLADAPRGFVLVTYRGLPLGFVKSVGNRCNNLYPSAWRIRMNPTDFTPFSIL